MSHDPLDLGPTRRHFTPGSEVFGRYELLERIGHGKLGDVWKARDKRLDLTLAIKLMENFAEFSAVASTVGKAFGLTHPNIVRTYAFEGDADLCGYIMEYVKGQTLTDIVRTKQPPFFEVSEVRPWAVQLFTALKFAWEQGGLVHGDVRPGNLFITSSGTLKIAEFGLAAARQGKSMTEDVHGPSALALPFLSPQRIADASPDHLDDVYSAGACLYAALTGKSVFPGGNVIGQILRKVPPSVAERRAELERKGEAVPKAWEGLIARCLAKEREDRPASAAEVLATLDTLSDVATRGTAGSRSTKVLGGIATADRMAILKQPRSLVAAGLAVFAALAFFLVIKPRNDVLTAMRSATKQLRRDDAASGAIPANRQAAWESFVALYNLKPVAFTEEDDTLITAANDRIEHWVTEARRRTSEDEDRQRKLAETTRRLRAAIAQQQQADTNKSFTTADRISAWAAVMTQFADGNQPDTKDYHDLLAQVTAAQKQWSDKAAAAKQMQAAEASRMVDETRIAEQKAARWREDRESAWAAISTLCSDPATSAFVKAEKLIAFQPTLADAPAGAEKRASELLALANDATTKALAVANAETPKDPLKIPELLADSPVKDQPAPVQRAFVAQMQQKLKDKGLYKDDPDGIHGRGSHNALVAYQKDTKRLVANGRLDAPTLKDLALDQPDLAALADEGKKLAAEESRGSSGGSRRKSAEPAEETGFWRKIGNGFRDAGKAVGKAVK